MLREVALPSLELPAIAELASVPQWVCWREDVRRGKPTKVPVTPRGSSASTTDPRTWSSYQACIAALVQGDVKLRLAGIGFVLTRHDPYVGVDLDKCLDGTALEPWAVELVRALDSYTERSPSGRGLHILCRGRLPEGWNRTGRIERYESERYLTVTGAHWAGSPETIEERTGALASMRGPERPRVVPLRAEGATIVLDPSASPPAEKLAALLANDRKFKLSWEHRRTDLADTSLSTYDLSLASLALGAAWDDQEIADLLIAHRRMAGDIGKALRLDYIERTIATARAARTDGLPDARADLRGIETDAETAEDALSRIRSQLRVPLRRIVRLGDEQPLYALILDDGLEIILGRSSDLLQQTRVRALVLDATRGLVLPRLKGERWDAIVGLVVAHAEALGADEVAEIDLVSITNGWIHDYLADCPKPLDVSDDTLRSGSPLRGEDGSVLINAPELARWVSLYRSEKLTTRELALRLRACGHQPARIDYGPERGRRTRRLWKVSAASHAS